MKITTPEKAFKWLDESGRAMKEGREPPMPENADEVLKLLGTAFAEIRSQEQQADYDRLREQLEELSKPKSKTLAEEYGMEDYTP